MDMVLISNHKCSYIERFVKLMPYLRYMHIDELAAAFCLHLIIPKQYCFTA